MAIVYCAVRRNFFMMLGATAKNDLSGDRTMTRCVGPVSNPFSSGQFWAVGICQDARVSMSPGLPRFVAEVSCAAGCAGIGVGAAGCCGVRAAGCAGMGTGATGGGAVLGKGNERGKKMSDIAHNGQTGAGESLR